MHAKFGGPSYNSFRDICVTDRMTESQNDRMTESQNHRRTKSTVELGDPPGSPPKKKSSTILAELSHPKKY